MLRLILLAGIIYVLFKWLFRSAPSTPRPRPFDQPGERIEEMVKDPVCGTYVPLGQAVSLPGENETRYFCSNECREKFLQKRPDNQH